jgi:RNA polymerase sigma-70 factor (ECF subfamily)
LIRFDTLYIRINLSVFYRIVSRDSDVDPNKKLVVKPPSSPTNNQSSLTQSNDELFMTLFEADRRRLYAYIYAYVMSKAAADDIFQETSMVLWKEFAKFEPNTDFAKWANGIAFNRIRVFRRDNKKYSLGLSEELSLEIDDSVDQLSLSATRWDILQRCLSGLKGPEFELYQAFYVNNQKAAEIAEHTGRSIFAIRKVIHKLRKKLFDCADLNSQRGAS